MQKEIICKVWNKKRNIGIDSDGNYLAKIKDGRIVPCEKEVHKGSIHYRPQFTSTRVSANQLNKVEDIIYGFILQHFCPF